VHIIFSPFSHSRLFISAGVNQDLAMSLSQRPQKQKQLKLVKRLKYQGSLGSRCKTRKRIRLMWSWKLGYLLAKRCNTIRYEMVYLHALNSWWKGQFLNPAHWTKNDKI